MEPTTYDTPGDLDLEVRIPAGEVRLRTSDTDRTTVHVTGERESDEVEVTFGPGADGRHSLRVEQRRKGRVGWRQRGLTVAVTAPERTSVRVEGGSTDLAVSGRVDRVRFACGSGDASLEDVTGDIDVKVASGDVRAGRVGGSTTVHSASGDVDVAATDGAVVRTASGDVWVGASSGQVRVTTLSGDVHLGSAASGSINVQAVSGDVTVGVDAGTRVFLDLSSVSGTTSSDLPVSDLPSDGDGPTLDVRASAVSGDVRVRRSTARTDAA
jgi:hypothetical protein